MCVKGANRGEEALQAFTSKCVHPAVVVVIEYRLFQEAVSVRCQSPVSDES